MSKHNISIILLIIVVGLFVSCEPQMGKSGLKIGYTQEPPFSYISNQGNASGIFPKVASKIAQNLGYSDVEWVLLSFDSLMPALLENRVDVIAAGMSVTQDRASQVCFTKPLVASYSAALWNKSNSEFKSDEPISKQDIKVAVVHGSVEASFARQRLSTRNVIEIEDPRLGLFAIENQQADVLLLTEPSLQHLDSYGPELFNVKKIAMLGDDLQQAAFVLRPNDHALAKRWNVEQSNIINTQWFLNEVKPYEFTLAKNTHNQTTCHQP